MINLILHVGDTFDYKGKTYKARAAEIKKGKFVDIPLCDGCSLFVKKETKCLREVDMPLCTRDYCTPLIFVEQTN